MEMSQRNPLYSYLKQKCFFSKTENRKVNQVLFGVGTSVGAGGGRYKESVREGEWGENTMYSCMKMEK
jgi:hypothetical protein